MNTTQPHAGWFESIKNLFHWEAIKMKFYQHQSYLIELGLAFGLGFLVGFLVKKFGRFFAIVIAALVVIGILQQLGFISVLVNWSHVHETLGIAPVPTVDASLINQGFEWVKEHSVQTLLFVLGTVFGMRLA